MIPIDRRRSASARTTHDDSPLSPDCETDPIFSRLYLAQRHVIHAPRPRPQRFDKTVEPYRVGRLRFDLDCAVFSVPHSSNYGQFKCFHANVVPEADALDVASDHNADGFHDPKYA